LSGRGGSLTRPVNFSMGGFETRPYNGNAGILRPQRGIGMTWQAMRRSKDAEERRSEATST